MIVGIVSVKKVFKCAKNHLLMWFWQRFNPPQTQISSISQKLPSVSLSWQQIQSQFTRIHFTPWLCLLYLLFLKPFWKYIWSKTNDIDGLSFCQNRHVQLSAFASFSILKPAPNFECEKKVLKAKLSHSWEFLWLRIIRWHHLLSSLCTHWKVGFGRVVIVFTPHHHK